MSDPFHVPLGRHLMSGAVHHARPFWRWLGNVETRALRARIDRTPVVKPVYVAGLARSGTSILIEVLASHPAVATHHYRDFPFLFIPYWWRQTLDRAGPPADGAAERAHGDRLRVSSGSPEAMEEVLWMAFFPGLHDPARRNALDAAASRPAFDRFYREHVSKLLLASGRARYAAKGNYNLTRLEYLRRLFPDARFVLPVRRPREHVASLVKQHRLFAAAARRHPRSVAHLGRVGHFEFGAGRRPINPDGRADVVESIEALWRRGEDARAWARYWAALHRWALSRLAADEALRRTALVVRYEDLCDRPAETVRRVLDHCDLPDAGGELARRWAPSLSRPAYYEPSFTPAEERAIDEETGEVAAELGYGSG